MKSSTRRWRGDVSRPGAGLAKSALRGCSWVIVSLLATVVAAQPRITRRDETEESLASLRQSVAAELPEAAGVASLDVLPRYDLDLDLDAAHGRFGLTETLRYTNQESAPLDELVLTINANTVPGPAPVNVRATRCEGATCATSREGTTTLVFRPEAPLAPGAVLTVVIELEGRLRVIDSSRTNMLAQSMESLASLSRGGSTGTDYGLLATGDGIASLAGFYAVVARRESNAWVHRESSTMGDLGSDQMSHVHATIVVDRGVKVVTSGVITGRRRVGHRVSLRVSADMVRELALLASRRFEHASRRVGDVEVRSWFLPEHREAGARVLDVAAHSLGVFERRFGAYPYADLDVVEAALVGGAGGVEYSGLVTVASMFYQPPMAGVRTSSPLVAMQARMIEFVTAHEVAHQWWHGLVGSDSRAHPHVDESLAQWSAMLYLEERYGRARAEEDANTQVRMGYQMMRAQGVEDGAVDRPVDAFTGQLDYGGLVYGKGPYVYPALRRAVGDARFFSAMRQYVNAYRYRVAPPEGLLDLLARGARARRVRQIATHWLVEAHGDADLGRLDPRAVISSLLGPEAARALAPQLGSLDDSGLMGMPGLGSGDGAGPTPAELRQMEQAFQQMMNQLPTSP